MKLHITRTRAFALVSLLFCLLTGFNVSVSYAQQGALELSYTKASDLYAEGVYVAARDSLILLAGREGLSPSLKQRTHRLLGIIHTMLRDHSSALDAIRSWIEADTTEVSADLENDYPEFVKLYVSAQKSKNIAEYCPADYDPPHPCEQGEVLDPGVQRIAVFPFENLSLDDFDKYQNMSQLIARGMIKHLVTANRLDVLERAFLNHLLAELNLRNLKAFDKNTAARIGRLLGAHAVVVGEFSYAELEKGKRKFKIGARLVEVETGKIIGAAELNKNLSVHEETLYQVAQEIVAVIDRNIASGAFDRGTSWENRLDAQLATAGGIALFDEAYANNDVDVGKLEEARAKFEEALGILPGFEPAELKLDQIKRAITVAR